MAYRIEFLPSAAKEFAALPTKARIQAMRKIDALQEEPRPRGSKALQGKARGLRRIRSGSFRIIYRIRDERLLVCVIRVGNRKDVHRGR